MTLLKAAVVVLALAFARCSAYAADWSFCIAPAQNENRIYISEQFPSTGATKAEENFREALLAQRLRHDSVQCPRAPDEAAAIIMRQHAIAVNHEWGRQVIDIPWRPLR